MKEIIKDLQSAIHSTQVRRDELMLKGSSFKNEVASLASYQQGLTYALDIVMKGV